MDADGWTWFAPSATHGAILRADPISCLQHVGRKQCVNSLMLMPRCEKPWEKIKLSHELRHMMATCLWHTIFRFWSCSVQGGLVSEQFLSESWVVLLLVPWMQTRLMLQCDLHTTVFFSQRFPLWPTKAIPSSVCPKVSIWSTEIGCTSVWFRRKSWDLFDRLWLLWAPKSIEIRCLQWAQLSHWGTRGYTPGGCCCLCCSWSRESRGSRRSLGCLFSQILQRWTTSGSHSYGPHRCPGCLGINDSWRIWSMIYYASTMLYRIEQQKISIYLFHLISILSSTAACKMNQNDMGPPGCHVAI